MAKRCGASHRHPTMRWIWIDRIVSLEPRHRCVTIKNITLSEDVVHDHFPATEHHAALPVFPNTLIIEGMAQTAGVLVGHANDFREKVLLAKINHAVFDEDARPGHTLRYTATIERLDDTGASTTGIVERLDPAQPQATVELGRVDLMFSHIDKARTHLQLPEHNFVFTGHFIQLIEQCGLKHDAT